MESDAALTLLERFRGCLLGHAVGDALGAPFETMPASAIYYQFGFARKIVARPPVQRLEYTDDTQMMIGVAETLVACGGRIDPDRLMAAFVANFAETRAYGPGTHQIIEASAAGGDWRTLAKTIFPGGSLGNGAAMRVSPVGLLFHDDIEQLADQAVLSAIPTHTHPIGMDGARLLGIAVALALQEPLIEPARFFAQLQRHAATEEFSTALARATELTWTGDIGLLGTSLEADRSVTAALACFASYPDSYPDAVGRAIGLGGDTDTVAAMAGALCGARLGAQAIPAHLLKMLEDGPKGRGYLEEMAGRLHALWEDRHDGV